MLSLLGVRASIIGEEPDEHRSPDVLVGLSLGLLLNNGVEEAHPVGALHQVPLRVTKTYPFLDMGTFIA